MAVIWPPDIICYNCNFLIISSEKPGTTSAFYGFFRIAKTKSKNFFQKIIHNRHFAARIMLSKIFLEKFSYFNRCYPLKFRKKKIFFKKNNH